MLIKDPEVQSIFRMYIENILATSKNYEMASGFETLLGFDDFPLIIAFLC